MARLTLQTGPGVFEVLANVCHSHQDAASQFVENAADAIQQLGIDGGRISINLQYKETPDAEEPRVLKNIVISDNGVGMSKEKMQQIIKHIGDSEKVKLALRGEKGIGILAFPLVAQELHIASTAAMLF
ncbi:ATP-binding protein, partial [Chloroflexota bacterium]